MCVSAPLSFERIFLHISYASGTTIFLIAAYVSGEDSLCQENKARATELEAATPP